MGRRPAHPASARRSPASETLLNPSLRKQRRWKKLPASYNVVAMPLLLSILMTAIVSAIVTLKNVGLQPGVTRLWFDAWLVSWAIAFPTLLVVLPLVRNIVAALVEQTQPASLDQP